jgi:hypothetical protein
VGLGSQLAGMQGANAVTRTNAYLGPTGDYYNSLENVNDIPPNDPSGLYAQLGANSAQPPQPQGHWYDSLIGGAAPAVGAGVGSYAAGGGFGGWGGGGGLPSSSFSGNAGNYGLSPLPNSGLGGAVMPNAKAIIPAARARRYNPIALGKNFSNRWAA